MNDRKNRTGEKNGSEDEMRAERDFPKVVITKKGVRWVEEGHPWVYEGEVLSVTPDAKDGGVADVVSEGGKYLGSGFYNSKSKIRVRLLSRNANDRFDEAFFARRIRYALDYRRTVMGEDFSCCRLIFGEADGFPGLTVDRFSNLLSAEVLSKGIEDRKEMIFREIVKQLRGDGEIIDGLYERNESAIRLLEGLEKGKGWFDFLGEKVPESAVTEITENGIRYEVDVENGQKTGFFLDQKYNRLAVMKLSKGKKVLDCFTHTGSFALNAAKGGASFVTAVDVSASAIEAAKRNAVRNGLSDRMEFRVADVFDLLPELEKQGGHPYDLIILDPPAFTKSRKTAENAEKGYKEINYRAMKILPRGGYLATASCSHFMPNERFEKMLRSAASDAGVELKQIEVRQQAADHPVLWNVPETAYLKFYLFQVI